MSHRLDPCIVHSLPAAPRFFGREQVRAELCQLWTGGFAGVVSLVGLGGAGKTALAAKFLDEITHDPSPQLAPEGLFVWSFYREPDAGQFLRGTLQYFSGAAQATAGAQGMGLVHLLVEALGTGRRNLVVLDGLERVQLVGERNAADYGCLEDPILKTFLRRAAIGIGRTLVLVTSRFPLADIERMPEKAYRAVSLGGLEAPAAVELLRGCGVHGDDEALRGLAAEYGDHALTLDHLGGLIGQFLNGDPSRVPDLPPPETSAADPQAVRLARLLRQYEEHLPAAERELLMQLGLFRRPVNDEQLISLLVCSPRVHIQAAREAVEAALRGSQATTIDAQEWERELSRAAGETLETVLFAAATAGPEAAFRREVIEIMQAGVATAGRALGDEAADVARLYAYLGDDTADDERPLSANDRVRLRVLFSHYAQLGLQPLATAPPSSLLHTLQDLGFVDAPSWRRDVDLGPVDLQKAITRTATQLARVIAKHHVLRRLRQLVGRYQSKWRRAGVLATLDARQLRDAIESLARRHLVLRGEGGRLEVHPAVQDHFRRLAGESQARHDAIREHLLSLAQRPGMRLPADPATLDLIEEAVYHSLAAGHEEEAISLYEQTLGGHRHLAWKLGEVARGLRIVRMFPGRPARWALGWYLRSLGEIDEAYRQHNLSYFRADIRLLQGRLPEVAQEGDPHRTAVAALLMGERQSVPYLELGCAIPLTQLYLYLGHTEQAVKAAGVVDLYSDYGWEGDRARVQLFLADAELRLNQLTESQNHLDVAAGWVLHSGSMEHLALLHLVRARRARIAGDRPQHLASIDDGLHVAKQCGFALYEIELTCERALYFFDVDSLDAAEQQARDALRMATDDGCRFVWGALAARHLLGRALLRRKQFDEARSVLQQALDDASRLRHPRAETIRHLLSNADLPLPPGEGRGEGGLR